MKITVRYFLDQERMNQSIVTMPVTMLRLLTRNFHQLTVQYRPGGQVRTMTKELNDNPGPGSHEATSQLSGFKFGFGSSTKLPKKDDKGPGPGYYKINT